MIYKSSILLIILSLLLIFSLLLCFLILRKKKESFQFNGINQLHRGLKLKYGELSQELPEQQMIFKHIKPDCKILELGPNIGRSSIIANSLLRDKSKHLCVETISGTCKKLKENRDLNNLQFQIFEGAISNSNLYQHPNKWRASKIKKDGYIQINTKPYSYLIAKYNINFDTIIADCEGCVFELFKENEYILNNIKLIIIEHDFNTKEQLYFFYKLMLKYNFRLIDKVTKKSVGLERWKDGISSDPIFVSVWKK